MWSFRNNDSFAPFQKKIAQIGPNRMFTGGLILSSFGTMLYRFVLNYSLVGLINSPSHVNLPYFPSSLLPLFPSSSSFFIAAMGFRCASALGNAAFRTSSLTLIAQHFPNHVGSVVVRSFPHQYYCISLSLPLNLRDFPKRACPLGSSLGQQLAVAFMNWADSHCHSWHLAF
jgi:hypothetical protein